MRKKSENYARDQVARMVQAGFPYIEAQRIRPYLEIAYLAGFKAGQMAPITEDVVMRERGMRVEILR